MLFLALGMIEFDGIFILIGYAMVVATLLYAVLGYYLGNAGKLGQLYTSCIDIP